MILLGSRGTVFGLLSEVFFCLRLKDLRIDSEGFENVVAGWCGQLFQLHENLLVSVGVD